MQSEIHVRVRSVALEIRAAETALMAERMRALGAWGAYAALSSLASSRRQRAERMRRPSEPRALAG